MRNMTRSLNLKRMLIISMIAIFTIMSVACSTKDDKNFEFTWTDLSPDNLASTRAKIQAHLDDSDVEKVILVFRQQGRWEVNLVQTPALFSALESILDMSSDVTGSGTLDVIDILAANKATLEGRGFTVETPVVGAVGQAGGTIFFLNAGYVHGSDWFALEMAPASTQQGAIRWYHAMTETQVGALATELTIGSGKQNTATIVAALSAAGDTGMAAQIAATLVHGGKNDWFLPSKDELSLVYENRAGNGFEPDGSQYFDFWSSSTSDRDPGRVWSTDFNNGNPWDIFGDAEASVRAIRRF
jgi:hypothetical protein